MIDRRLSWIRTCHVLSRNLPTLINFQQHNSTCESSLKRSLLTVSLSLSDPGNLLCSKSPSRYLRSESKMALTIKDSHCSLVDAVMPCDSSHKNIIGSWESWKVHWWTLTERFDLSSDLTVYQYNNQRNGRFRFQMIDYDYDYDA